MSKRISARINDDLHQKIRILMAMNKMGSFQKEIETALENRVKEIEEKNNLAD